MKEHYTIEPHPTFIYVVYKHDQYPESSVNHGMTRRSFITTGNSLRTLKEQYPDAEALNYSTKIDQQLPHTAPSWFDPANAGERWDDDY